MKITPYAKKDFHWARWKPEDIRAVVPAILAEKKRRYAEIKAIPDAERTFQNTVAALERAGSDVSDRIHCIDFLMNVSSDDAVRTAAHEAINKLRAELIELDYDKGIWRALVAYAKKRRERLIGADKKLFRDTLRDYRRMGFVLPPKKCALLKENTKKLAQWETSFQKNINDHYDAMALPPAETDGLPVAYLAGLKKDARGNYLVSLAYPDYFPFLQNSPHENRRRELMDKYLHKGGAANIRILNKMLAVRDKNAKLLGYQNHAAFRTEIKMAKKPEAVFSFLNGLVKKLEKGTVRELSAVRALKRTMTGDSRAALFYYDIASSAASYYMNELKKQTLALDDEEIRAYFPLNRVLAGMFGMYERLLSVKFIPLSGYPLWHKDAMLYGIRNKKEKGSGMCAYFAMDMYPREGKYGHAAAFEIFGGRAEQSGKNENYRAPFAALVCNFRKPTKQAPSLLSHSEVETLFHEFGHIMHQTL
ncbi:MAG: M3 family metallopeptidase, partial [Candidatus Sungbacteria bacterium]|nr:M3 family metallopeptidase [Candidatus Sungbacteria bacterium]